MLPLLVMNQSHSLWHTSMNLLGTTSSPISHHRVSANGYESHRAFTFIDDSPLIGLFFRFSEGIEVVRRNFDFLHNLSGFLTLRILRFLTYRWCFTLPLMFLFAGLVSISLLASASVKPVSCWAFNLAWANALLTLPILWILSYRCRFSACLSVFPFLLYVHCFGIASEVLRLNIWLTELSFHYCLLFRYCLRHYDPQSCRKNWAYSRICHQCHHSFICAWGRFWIQIFRSLVYWHLSSASSVSNISKNDAVPSKGDI